MNYVILIQVTVEIEFIPLSTQHFGLFLFSGNLHFFLTRMHFYFYIAHLLSGYISVYINFIITRITA